MPEAPRDGGSRSPQVSPITVPLLLLGLLVGFFAGYLLAWTGAIVVGVLLLGTLSMVLSGRSRDAAAALAVGAVGGYVIVLALAFFRGVM
ncbi:hypothetical protein ACXET9_04025 [Brachybacterium sp. DNPG3]